MRPPVCMQLAKVISSARHPLIADPRIHSVAAWQLLKLSSTRSSIVSCFPCVGTVHSGTRQGTWRSMWRIEFQVRPYPSVDRIKEIQFFDVLITEIPAIATVFCGHLVATGPVPNCPVHVHPGTNVQSRLLVSGPHSQTPARQRIEVVLTGATFP